MNISDFLAGELTTHSLLYRMIGSELGLFSVASTATQFEALVAACGDLKKGAIESVGKTSEFQVEMPDYSLLKISISGRDEAHLFLELYKGLELFTGGTAFADEYSQKVTLDNLVYRMAVKAIEAHQVLCDAMICQIKDHMAKYGEAVRSRMVTDLKRLRFSDAFIHQCES